MVTKSSMSTKIIRSLLSFALMLISIAIDLQNTLKYRNDLENFESLSQ